MDVFEEGRFPFGTDCSGGRGRAFCVSGRCQKFSDEGTPLDEESATPRALQRRRRRRRIKRNASTFGNGTTFAAVEEGDVRWGAAEKQRPPTSVPETNHTAEPPHPWKVHMSDCSLPCGGGTHNVTVQCEAPGTYPNASHCGQSQRPALKTGPLACNAEPCTGRWHMEPWGTCTHGSLQSRLVVCVEPLEVRAPADITAERRERHAAATTVTARLHVTLVVQVNLP
ncbi:hypothetical protein V5799_016027 [Amblyomma americanum]|uniref:Uncharacterized protein n=1 Tax=Amblyomma americanum TaxID=6943 RepID=A0AAQ4F6X8_AMBAM